MKKIQIPHFSPFPRKSPRMCDMIRGKTSCPRTYFHTRFTFLMIRSCSREKLFHPFGPKTFSSFPVPEVITNKSRIELHFGFFLEVKEAKNGEKNLRRKRHPLLRTRSVGKRASIFFFSQWWWWSCGASRASSYYRKVHTCGWLVSSWVVILLPRKPSRWLLRCSGMEKSKDDWLGFPRSFLDILNR